MTQACQERQTTLAEHIIAVVNGWWERNPQIAEAVHALYFGDPNPEQLAQQRAFDELQQRFLREVQRSHAADPKIFLNRCQLLLEQLGREAVPALKTGQGGLLT